MDLSLLYENIPINTIKETISVMCEYKDIPKKYKLVIIDTKKIDNSWKKQKIILVNLIL